MTQKPEAAPETDRLQVSTDSRPEIIAIRKTCDAEGTGLSHFVLMDKLVKRDER